MFIKPNAANLRAALRSTVIVRTKVLKSNAARSLITVIELTPHASAPSPCIGLTDKGTFQVGVMGNRMVIKSASNSLNFLNEQVT